MGMSKAVIVGLFALLISVAAAAQPITSPEQQGHADRASFETWIQGITGDERRGADFWVGQRSLAKPQSCFTFDGAPNPTFTSGCQEAQQRLAVPDVRRRTEADYKAGWNASLTAIPPAPPPPAVPPVDAPAAHSDAVSDNDDYIRPRVRPQNTKFPDLNSGHCKNVTFTGVAASSPSLLDHVAEMLRMADRDRAGQFLDDILARDPIRCKLPVNPLIRIFGDCSGLSFFVLKEGTYQGIFFGYMGVEVELDLTFGKQSTTLWINPELVACSKH